MRPSVAPHAPASRAWQQSRRLRRLIHDRIGSDASFHRAVIEAGLYGVGRATSRVRTLPDYIVIGGQRCGTTFLHRYLLLHPNVLGSYRKEVGYFDDHFSQGAEWYRAHFPSHLAASYVRRVTGHAPVVGEATPYYLFHPQTPKRVANLLPNVKLIALLRDPTDRAYSSYKLQRSLGIERLSFEDALASEAQRLCGEEHRLCEDPSYVSPNHRHFSYLQRGLYASQLTRWFDAFPRDQLLIVFSEDLFNDPASVMPRVQQFLSLPEVDLGPYGRTNATRPAHLSPTTRRWLNEYFARPNRHLAELLGSAPPWATAAS